ncbi:hypothetical protein [Streptomyces sp. TN58]|uniref:hypothetical protein n=1 Tax=Streptomyces sp. TN58 TaxID=234612 RepID=UPI0009A1BA75|nr:hypothetical protein [Streptomyces sp. TN58]
MTHPFSVDRMLGTRPFAEIGHPALAVADGRRGLLAVTGTHGFSHHPAVGVYDSATLSCRALVRSRDVVQAMAFHPTLPLLAVGTGSYDGGYFFTGDLLLLDLETGTSISAFEDGQGRQVLELEWLDEQRLRLLMAPPDDWQDEEAHTPRAHRSGRPARLGLGAGKVHPPRRTGRPPGYPHPVPTAGRPRTGW